MVMKIHHAVTDGVGGVGLLPIFTDLEPDPAEAPTLSNGARRPARTRPVADARREQFASLATSAAASVQDVAMHPGATVSMVPRAARSTAKLLAPATSSLSPVTTGRGLDRHFEIVHVGLEDLAAAGKAVGGTVNDAFLAAVVGGLQRYHQRHGHTVDELRVTMPINLRSAEDRPGGNRFTPGAVRRAGLRSRTRRRAWRPSAGSPGAGERSRPSGSRTSSPASSAISPAR